MNRFAKNRVPTKLAQTEISVQETKTINIAVDFSKNKEEKEYWNYVSISYVFFASIHCSKYESTHPLSDHIPGMKQKFPSFIL